MSDLSSKTALSSVSRSQRVRRVLLGVQGQGSVLRAELIATGYETAASKLDAMLALIADYVPDVVIFELADPNEENEQQVLAMARRLRSEASTYALPLVFCWYKEDRTVRATLLSIGADDYFSISLPIRETLARLDSLFWRIESGRRTAGSAGDQRLDIDNFMLLLDSVRDDIRTGNVGSIGLLYACQTAAGTTLDRAERDRTLSKANGFFKLNLRRADAATFYGPTTLLIYMPGFALPDAAQKLREMREGFMRDHPNRDFAVGIASFPSNDDSVEAIMERAEAGAVMAREPQSLNRIVALGLVEPEPTAKVEIPKIEQVHLEPETPAIVAEIPAVIEAAPVSLDIPYGEAPPPPAATHQATSISNDAVAAPKLGTTEEAAFESDAEVEIDLVDFESGGIATVEESTLIEDSFRIAAKPSEYNPPPEPVSVPLVPDVHLEEGIQLDAPYLQTQGKQISQVVSEERKPEEPTSSVYLESQPVHPDASPERANIYSAGFESETIRDLTMAELMQKVAATRSRSPTAVSANAPAAHEAATRERAIRESGAQMPGRLLLVVSDTRQMAAINSLVRGAGYDVRAAFNGRQALDLLRLEHPELLVVDYRLNGMDGLETVRRLRKQSGGRLAIPVVMLIAELEIDVRNEAVELGVHQIVSPSFEPAELLAAIRDAGHGD